MGGVVSLPPPGDAEYLFLFACEAGIYQLSWAELGAWKIATETKVGPWESAAIKLIADAYTNSRDVANNDALAPQPWQSAQIDRKTIDGQIRSALRGRKNR